MEDRLMLMPVSARMRVDVIRAGPDDSLLQVAQIMQLARIRHLPVVDAGVLVGMISHRDVLEASLSRLDEASPALRMNRLRAITVSQVMVTCVQTVAADATLAEAASAMLRYKIGCLPVVEARPEGAVMLGLLTESDLLTAAYVPDFEAGALVRGSSVLGGPACR